MLVWGPRARSPSRLLGTSPGPGGARLQKPQKPSPRLRGGAFRSSSSKPSPAPTCMYCSILSKAVKCASVSEPMRAVAWKILASWNGGEASRQVAAGSVQASTPWHLPVAMAPQTKTVAYKDGADASGGPEPTPEFRCSWRGQPDTVPPQSPLLLSTPQAPTQPTHGAAKTQGSEGLWEQPSPHGERSRR